MAEPTRLRAIDLWGAAQSQDVLPNAVRLFEEFTGTLMAEGVARTAQGRGHDTWREHTLHLTSRLIG